MVIDTSAILAISLAEPEAERIATAITSFSVRKMSAVNWLECLLVMESRRGEKAADDTLLILEQFGVEVVTFDREHLFEARHAWQRYGKGRHPAGLNMGDCCAYAASTVLSEPLLFKGGDFSRTDVQRLDW